MISWSVSEYVAKVVREYVAVELAALVRQEVGKHAVIIQLAQVRAEQERMAKQVDAIKGLVRDACASAKECRDAVTDCRRDTTHLAETCERLATACERILGPTVHA